MSKYIRFDDAPDIDTAAQKALQMANEQNSAVAFKFNGIPVTVEPGQEIAKTYQLYRQGCQSDRGTKISRFERVIKTALPRGTKVGIQGVSDERYFEVVLPGSTARSPEKVAHSVRKALGENHAGEFAYTVHDRTLRVPAMRGSYVSLALEKMSQQQAVQR